MIGIDRSVIGWLLLAAVATVLGWRRWSPAGRLLVLGTAAVALTYAIIRSRSFEW